MEEVGRWGLLTEKSGLLSQNGRVFWKEEQYRFIPFCQVTITHRGIRKPSPHSCWELRNNIVGMIYRALT